VHYDKAKEKKGEKGKKEGEYAQKNQHKNEATRCRAF
jgi:hypothetical protein